MELIVTAGASTVIVLDAECVKDVDGQVALNEETLLDQSSVIVTWICWVAPLLALFAGVYVAVLVDDEDTPVQV